MLPLIPQDADALAQDLPNGTSVFVTHLQRYPLDTALDVLDRLNAAGLKPIPHLAARRISSHNLLSSFLHQAVSRCGVRQALIVGGEADQPAGPFADALSLLKTSLLRESGLEQVAFAAYPNGHPAISHARLMAALDDKISCAGRQGLISSVVTQFCFSADQIAACAAGLRTRYPGIHLRIGVAGPSDVMTLLKYARLCGVPAASKFVGGQTSDAWRLAAGADPARLIEATAGALAAAGLHNDISVHLFSFGGPRKAAIWLRSVTKG